MSITEVSFAVSNDDRRLIRLVLDRAKGMNLLTQARVSHEMDLVATHANGCPLDFKRWLELDAFSFTHDFVGIARHLDRSTGRLGDCFRPRCAKPSAGDVA